MNSKGKGASLVYKLGKRIRIGKCHKARMSPKNAVCNYVEGIGGMERMPRSSLKVGVERDGGSLSNSV